MADVFLALPVIHAIRLLEFTMNLVVGESFPVQKTGGMRHPSYIVPSGRLVLTLLQTNELDVAWSSQFHEWCWLVPHRRCYPPHKILSYSLAERTRVPDLVDFPGGRRSVESGWKQTAVSPPGA
jgi:hypothetical protein